VVLAAELSWLVGRPDGGCPAERPAGIQRLSTQRLRRPGPTVKPSGVRPSGVQPVRCPPVRCPARPVSTRPVSSPSGVHPSGVQPAAVRLRSVRTRPSRPTSGGGGGDQVEAAGNRYHRNGPRSRWAAASWSGSMDGRAGRTRAMLPRSRWSVGRWRTRARSGDGGRPRLPGCATRQPRPACGAPSLVAARWAREQAAREVAAAAGWLPSGAGWRPRWVVVMGPAARVGGLGRADGRADGDGRAAPARPSLAAGAPGSLPTAL
jgi:hypothetical protein